MNVRERQNKQCSLDKLVAQRFLYRRAKWVEILRRLSVVIIAVVLLLGLAAEREIFSQVAALIVVILWFLDQMVGSIPTKEQSATWKPVSVPRFRGGFPAVSTRSLA